MLLMTASAIPQVHMLLESNKQYHQARAQELLQRSGFSADNFNIRRSFLPPTECSVHCVRSVHAPHSTRARRFEPNNIGEER